MYVTKRGMVVGAPLDPLIVKMGLSVRLFKAYFGETFSEEAEKAIGYLVAKNILGFLCAHENDTFDNLFLPMFTTTFVVLLRALGISHLNKTFHCGAEGLATLVFVDALL